MLALFLGACGGDSGTTKSAEPGEVVRASMKAWNDKDGKAFAERFTDKGLEEFDGGTREEILSGKATDFGEYSIEIVYLDVTPASRKSTVEVGVADGDFSVAQVVNVVAFTLVKKGDDWLIDGFEYKGSPESRGDAVVVPITGREYSFSLPAETTRTNVAFTFENAGQQQHEVILFRAPDGTDVATAKAALESVPTPKITNAPKGYAGDYLTYAEAGEKTNVNLGQPLKPGTYFMICDVPEGGYDDEGNATPDAKPHVQLGMIARLLVTLT